MIPCHTVQECKLLWNNIMNIYWTQLQKYLFDRHQHVIGMIDSLLLDPQKGVICFAVSKKKIFPIQSISAQGVMIDNTSMPFDLHQLLYINILSLEVRTIDNKKIGTITDYCFHTDTCNLVSFVVTKLFLGIFRQKRIIAKKSIYKITKNIVYITDDIAMLKHPLTQSQIEASFT